jgi:hypothetical protein
VSTDYTNIYYYGSGNSDTSNTGTATVGTTGTVRHGLPTLSPPVCLSLSLSPCLSLPLSLSSVVSEQTCIGSWFSYQSDILRASNLRLTVLS